MRPRLPTCDQLADVRAWRDGLWKATWRADGGLVLVKAWPVPGGSEAQARLKWQEQAALALGDATPEVLWRAVEAEQIGSVVRWVEGTSPQAPLSLDVLRQLLEALGRLHGAGLVHRDVCPRNLLLTPEGKLLVIDLDDVAERGAQVDVVGTPAHMAPELSSGGRPTPSTDLFAVGTLLDPEKTPLLATLSRATQPAFRAEQAQELLCLFPLALDGAPPAEALTGPSTLFEVPEQATTLRRRAGGEAALARLSGVGWGRAKPDGSRQLSPEDIHRWRALVEGPLGVDRLRDLVAAGAPGQALWSMVDHPAQGNWSVARVDTFGAAAFETYQAAAQRRALAVLRHTSCVDPTVPHFWATLLEGALRLQKGDAHGVFESISSLPRSERPWARRARDVSLIRAALGSSPNKARETLDAVAALPSPDDPDTEPRLLAWSGLLDYRQGRYDAARARLTAAWRKRPFVHTRGMTASNLLAILLHLDSPAEAEAIAREALQMLPPGAHPIAAARLATKMREAIYRGHAEPVPDIDLLEAILPGLPPVSAALAVLNEAAAAWRSGDLPLATRLSDDAARRFQASRFKPGELLAGALAVRTGHPGWESEADRLEAAVDSLLNRRRVWLPAIAAQVLGLLAAGPDDPLAEDATDIAAEVERSPEARREVLSLAECGRGGPAT